jgi:hypothetical protein
MLQISGGMQASGEHGEDLNSTAYLLASDAFLNMYNGMDPVEAVATYEREFEEFKAERGGEPGFDETLCETIVGAVLEPCLLRNYHGRIESMRGNRLCDGVTEYERWQEMQSRPPADHGGPLTPRQIDEHMNKVRAAQEEAKKVAAQAATAAPPTPQAAPAGKRPRPATTD